jgi:hypothetical protein
MDKKRNEPARQFEEIFREHHDPEMKYKKKILDNREKRKEDIREDLGI